MIYETLQILKEQLDNFFESQELGKIFLLGNIALLDSGGSDAQKLSGKVVITLLNLEEEATLKNSPHFNIRNGKAEYKNPPITLNLFILISANCDTYDNSLLSISKVIQFFQGKKTFTAKNTVFNSAGMDAGLLDSFKFNVELYTPSFEEMNYVWGTLGGKQLPSVIYKVQLIQIDNERVLSKADAITGLSNKLKFNNQ